MSEDRLLVPRRVEVSISTAKAVGDATVAVLDDVDGEEIVRECRVEFVSLFAPNPMPICSERITTNSSM